MAKPRSRQRQKPLAARALLLALAFSGTFAGWGVLAQSARQAATANNTVASSADASAVAVPTQSTLQPLPTILPPPPALVLNTNSQALPTPSAVQLAPIPALSRQVVVRPIVRARSSR